MVRGSKRALELLGDGANEHNELRAYHFAKARATKISLALILSILSERGLLIDDRIGWDVQSERRAIERAVAAHAEADTPYGKVVQQLDLGSDIM